MAFTWLLLAGRNARCGATRVRVLAVRLEALYQAPSYSGALGVCCAEARARCQVVAGSAALLSLESVNKRRTSDAPSA